MQPFYQRSLPVLFLFSATLLLLVGCSESNAPQQKTESEEANASRSVEEGNANIEAGIENNGIQVGQKSAPKKVVPGVPMIKGTSPRRPVASTKAIPATAARALISPGVDPKVSEEVATISRDHREQIEKATETGQLQGVFQATHQSFDRLASQHQGDTKYPLTESFVLNKKLELFVDAINRDVPTAREDFDAYVATCEEQNAESEHTATAVGTRLSLQILPGQPSAEKEKLIDEYLRSYPGKSYAGQLVMLYGNLLANCDGPEARRKWFEQHVDNLTSSQASKIRRVLARTTIIGSMAELSGPKVNGDDFELTNLRGKVVLIDLWATWCGLCVGELPEVKKVYGEFRDRGFEVVGFSLDRSREPLEQFLAKHDYDWTQVYIPDEDLRTQVADRFGVSGIPATYLIDQQGKITAVNLRGHEQISKAVAELLGPSTEDETSK